jgi:hypothetical protein
MVRKYVKNWYSVLSVYAGLSSETRARFRDGEEVHLAKADYVRFYESLYRRHNTSHGMSYKPGANGETIVNVPGGLIMIERDEPFSHVLDEVFVMNVYGKPNLKGRLAIDVGAGVGDSSVYFASLGAMVYAFEPDPKRYELALQNIKTNGLQERIKLSNKPVTGGTGPDSLSEIIGSQQSSDVFVKIDCEGCEYSLLGTTDDTTFEKISDVVLEFHEGLSFVPRLKSLGFEVKRQKEIVQAHKVA